MEGDGEVARMWIDRGGDEVERRMRVVESGGEMVSRGGGEEVER
jgi:hypothetical protein